MAITAFTGPPGAGKSHALVKDVILPAVFAGRTVRSNIDGLNPDAIRGYCLTKLEGTGVDASTLGQVVLFHGDDMLRPGFFPDEATVAAGLETVVQPGELLVIDEWALYFPKRGRWPAGCNVAAFLRWHRHMTGEGGQATDVAIGTQLASDIHMDIRGLVSRSYKFRKLTSLGAQGSYAWFVYEGHLQPKDGYYQNGTGSYDRAVFPLYASSAAAASGTHVELKTNKKDSVWSGWRAKAVLAGVPVLLIVGVLVLWRAWAAMGGESVADPAKQNPQSAAAPAMRSPGGTAPVAGPANSPWRIVGIVQGVDGARVILSDNSGSVRMMTPDAFRFLDDRPVEGTVDGQRAVAQDQLPTSGGGMFQGVMQ